MRRIALAVPITALLLVAGCSADMNKDSSGGAPAAGGAGNISREGEEFDTAGDKPAAADDAAPATGDGAKRNTVINARAQTSREHIIKNAFITVETKDVDRARNEAVALAKAAGGDVASEERSGGEGGRSATLRLRVPPEDFDQLVTDIGKLGKVLTTKTETEDVTGQVADIEGRIEAAQDSARQIRKLVSRATAITDIVALEREYQARDAEIQSMSAQLASLKDRAGRSTVTVTLAEPASDVVDDDDREFTGFTGGLKSGWNAFVTAVTVLLTVLGAILPFAAVALVGLAIWLPIRRRRVHVPTPATPVADQPVS